MGYGPAVLSGLLSGLSGLPQGMQAATNEDLARQRLGLEQQQIDLQKQLMESGKFADLPSGAVPTGWGTPTPTGGVRVQTNTLPFLQHFMTQQQAQQDRAGSAAALRAAGERMGNPNLSVLADLLEKGALKDAGSAFETEQKAMQAQQERDYGTNILSALGIPVPERPPRPGMPTPVAAPQSAINPSLPAAQQPTVQAAGAGLANAISNLNATAKGLPGVPPGGGAGGVQSPMPAMPSAFRPDISFKAGPATVTLKTPSDERDAYASAMFNGLVFHQLRPDQQNRVMAQVRQDKIDQAAAQGQNAAAIPQRTPEGQIKDFSAIDLAQGQLNEMLRLAPKVNLPQIAGGLAPWVNSIAQTGKVGPIPVPPEVSGTLTPEQNRFLAMLQDYADQVLRLRSGAQINEQEFKRMLGFLASPDVRPDVLMQRLRLQQDFLRAKREGLASTLQGAGYRVPPPMAPSFQPPPGAPPPVETTPGATPTPQPSILQRILPGIFGGPQAAPQQPAGPPAQGKVRVRAPDGRTGNWDLSKGPIPPGFTQIP